MARSLQKISYAKFHAVGNDFIVVSQTGTRLPRRNWKEVVRAICHRRYGVGADGVLLCHEASEIVSMRIFNADGSEAELSGNGLRIIAHYLAAAEPGQKRTIAIKTRAGLRTVRIMKFRGNRALSAVNLPPARFAVRDIPLLVLGRYFINRSFRTRLGALLATAVNVGNPHLVFFVDSFNFDWRSLGSLCEKDRRFPEHTNVEFARIINRSLVEHRIWERGAGETGSSGTGAAAVVAAGIMNGLLDSRVTVREPAGEFIVECSSLENPIAVIGKSVHISDGIYYYAADAQDHL